MRTPRIIIIGAFFLAATVLTLFSTSSASADSQDISLLRSEQRDSAARTLFSFQRPFSLFPPNAIISLTDDNTTSFLARPAGFGPPLPPKGLSGQLWIGSGFGDDGLRQGTVAAGAEGELGCSDVPGWVAGNTKEGDVGASGDEKQTSSAGPKGHNRRNDVPASPVEGSSATDRSSKMADEPEMDDGTDDWLHHPLPASSLKKSDSGQQSHDSTTTNSNHADIQSLQEGAEIAGKVVLLSRGGCGFLEKVKWTQRRGGIALIVGDDKRGGPLLQMSASGDTSNVTIPSVFTSHTTAHLLSSLMSSGSYIEDTVDESGNLVSKVQSKAGKKNKNVGSQPTFTQTTAAAKATPTPTSTTKTSKKKAAPEKDTSKSAGSSKSGWFSWLFSKTSKSNSPSDSRRPPSSGRLDWILVDDWNEDSPEEAKTGPSKPTKGSSTTVKASPKNKDVADTGDGFVIGVQDWRDPDLVGSNESKDDKNQKSPSKPDAGKSPKHPSQSTSVPSKNQDAASADSAKANLGPKGGSITPGSGEYGGSHSAAQSASHSNKNDGSSKDRSKSSLLYKLFGEDEDESEALPLPNIGYKGPNTPHNEDDDDKDDGEHHEGVWVTLIQTNGASPFFDTLLILVVSPLVTLTVVYALLLLRSRIRRRRWRAPKSVVERLPVRTYQTVPSSAGSRAPSPTSSSPSTPLLQRANSGSRPRSRTTSGLPEPGDLLRASADTAQAPSRTAGHEHEKAAGVSSEWKKYMGKQIECVVCLEEYIAGVSRVMSLPCGHEFHVDCITPWLTTRRRTCPICKGDVVRSLARGSPSSPRYEPYHDDSDDDVQAQAAETVNNSPLATLPIPSNSDAGADADLEHGIASSSSTSSSSARSNNRETGLGITSWRSILSTSIGSSSRTVHEERRHQ